MMNCFNSEGQKLDMSESCTRGHGLICVKILREATVHSRELVLFELHDQPHVFVFIINVANLNDQTANLFLYHTFSVSKDPHTLNLFYLEVGNGNILKIITNTTNKGFQRCFEIGSREQLLQRWNTAQ